MFYKYNKKDKRKFIMMKAIVLAGIIIALLSAMLITKVKITSIPSGLKFTGGAIMIIFVGVLAVFNRIKELFKVKSLGFLYIAVALALLSQFIDVLIWSLFLVSIPLLFDDIVVYQYFKYIDITRYGAEVIKYRS